MDQQQLLDRCQTAANGLNPAQTSDHAWGPEDAIGFFQSLRPHGKELAEVFRHVPHGEELEARLLKVYKIAGEPLRPDGNKDAYFIVRNPIQLAPDTVKQAAHRWLENLSKLNRQVGDGSLSELLEANPLVRVLEGQPPKHPKKSDERSELLVQMLGFSERNIQPLQPPNATALVLRQACYFIACDAALCDYLLWPVYRTLVNFEDPFEPYFTLWTGGVKYRIFNNHTIDFYMPRYD